MKRIKTAVVNSLSDDQIATVETLIREKKKAGGLLERLPNEMLVKILSNLATKDLTYDMLFSRLKLTDLRIKGEGNLDLKIFKC